MMRQPISDNGLVSFAMLASAAMLITGAAYVITSVMPTQSRLNSLESAKSNSAVTAPRQIQPPQLPRIPVFQSRGPQISELSLEQKQRLAIIRNAIADVYAVSQDDWEQQFRRNAAPERKIAVWEHVTKFYTYFAEKRIATIAGHKELLEYLFQCAMGYGAGHAAQKRLKHIESKLAQTILGCYLFDTFSLDDPVAYPPEQLAEDEDPRPWLDGSTPAGI
jgi:hypothetical protein